MARLFLLIFVLFAVFGVAVFVLKGNQLSWNIVPTGQGPQAGPGGCRSQVECEAYCKDSSHWEECRLKAPKAVSEKPILKNLGINFGKWDKTTGKAGDFVFNKDHFISGYPKYLFLFGDNEPVPQGAARKISPTFTYYLPLDTTIFSPIDGEIKEIVYQPESSDYQITIVQGNDHRWFAMYDHLTDIKVKERQRVKAGDPIGKPGPRGPGWGFVELGVIYDEDSRGNKVTNYCPWDYFDPTLKNQYMGQFSQMMKDWEEFMEDSTIYDEAKMYAPGCLYDKLLETTGSKVWLPSEKSNW